MAATRDALDSLAPWDAIPYFQQPVEGKLTLTGFGAPPSIPADPNRVALMVQGNSAGNVVMSLKNDPLTQSGFIIINTLPPVSLLFSEVGPLCQQQWYFIGGVGGIVTFYAVSLSKWPRVQTRNGRTRRAPNA